MEQATKQPSSATTSAGVTHANARRLLLIVALAVTVLVADQATKAAIRAWLDVGERWLGAGSLLNLSHVENTGAAFGILQGAGSLLIGPAVVAIIAIAVLLLWSPPQRGIHGGVYTAALALILGGATGNLVDRIARGSVTDFIDPIHYPAFNIADSSIVVGVVALIALSFLEDEEDQEGEERST
jgi:signal peptidase II